jgi:hypothetical protein
MYFNFTNSLQSVSTSDSLALSFGLSGTIIGLFTLYVTRNRHSSQGKFSLHFLLRPPYASLVKSNKNTNCPDAPEQDVELGLLAPASTASTSTPTPQDEEVELTSSTPHPQPTPDPHQHYQAIGDALDAFARLVRIHN